jgi:hypothetical protein
MQKNNRDFSILKQRILEYLNNKGISKYEFYQKTGISNGILSQKGGISEDNILKILSCFNDINPTWLLTGEGEMLRVPMEEIGGAPPPPAKKGKDPPGCQLCAEKERVITSMQKQLVDKDKIIALLENQLKKNAKRARLKEGLLVLKLMPHYLLN